MNATRFVVYTRVSTRRQGHSGLGLEAQRQSVDAYVTRTPGATVVGEFVETESGRRNNRPQLAAALAACRMHGAVLLIAKLDRLSRNAAFLLSLRDSGIEFVAVDLPGASRLTIGILAMVAEQEAEMTSARTKAALQVARQRGVQLGRVGRTNFSDAGRAKGRPEAIAVRVERADERARDRAGYIEQLRREGCTTLTQLARGLERLGALTPRRKARWTEAQVARLLARLERGTAKRLSA